MSETKINFEETLSTLEALIEKMEQGDQTLEQSLEDFESGLRLVKSCQQALSQAEEKVRLLVMSNNNEGHNPPGSISTHDEEDVHD